MELRWKCEANPLQAPHDGSVRLHQLFRSLSLSHSAPLQCCATVFIAILLAWSKLRQPA
eukprot:UN4707